MAMHAYRFHSIEADGPWTSEPFPAAERRHIVQGVIGGFLSGRPRWATDIDGTFIYGLDAKGKEMKAAPVHHATMKTVKTVTVTAKKKSPAQLQREIDEALAGKSGRPVHATREVPTSFEEAKAEGALIEQEEKAAGEALQLFPRPMGLIPDAVRATPEYRTAKSRFDKAFARLRAFNGIFVKRFAKELRAERAERTRAREQRSGHAAKKRSTQARVVGKHGLGTADVRTGEGAYWIVTVPTGYRVDYKPWGPSSEVDLGTFKARTKARAKITAHARSVGAMIVS